MKNTPFILLGLLTLVTVGWLGFSCSPKKAGEQLPLSSNTGAVVLKQGKIGILVPDTGVMVTDHTQRVIIRKRTPGVVLVKKDLLGRAVEVEAVPAGQWQKQEAMPANPQDRAKPPAEIIIDSDPIRVTVPEETHSRVGVVAGNLPGVVALDVQVIRTHPLKSLGSDLEVGLDVQFNLAQVGGGISVGGKYFATVGQSVTFDGKTGWYGGLGIRF